ncbi:MAG TPA: hypothetical protein VF698_09785 [Thermoanaerobaculia bacterium]|jgi:hypothetical protein
MKITARLFLAALLLAALPLSAQTFDWSMPGSTGIQTQGGSFLATAAGPTLKFNSFSSGTLVSRYLVTNTFGSGGAGGSKTPGWTTLHAAFTDNSPSASVTAKLYEVDACTFTVTEICSISSSDAAGAQCASCVFNSSTFDFANNTYYVEVTLSRSATSGVAAEIHSVAIN